MNVVQCGLEGVVILEPKIFGDERGYFFESWNRARFEEIGLGVDFIQDNESMSLRGVLRGLHYQLPPYTQAKLIRVICGRVLDIAVDIRKGSPTFGKHVAIELTGENKRQAFIPRGFAHGFVALEENTIFAYKCDRPYMPSHDRGINPRDPALGIELSADFGADFAEFIISEKDLANPLLAEAELFEYSSRDAY